MHLVCHLKAGHVKTPRNKCKVKYLVKCKIKYRINFHENSVNLVLFKEVSQEDQSKMTGVSMGKKKFPSLTKM